MQYPPLVHYATVAEYRAHFDRVYCQGPLTTFDAIKVRFRREQFDHYFFESVKARDDTFSRRRAERIDWVAVALVDPGAELRVGWDNHRKRPAPNRRVAIVVQDYVVVIRMVRAGWAELVTAFVADARTLAQIRTNPLWKRKNR